MAVAVASADATSQRRDADDIMPGMLPVDRLRATRIVVELS